MRLMAIYRICCEQDEIVKKAQALAIEQSVEMPLDAIDDRFVLEEIIGKVETIEDCGDRSFRVCVSLAAATTGDEPGQLLNMLFGNSSLHDDVALEDVAMPPDMLPSFCGPASGIDGLRRRVGAEKRALTCAAIKPQGLSPQALAGLAFHFALGGVDYIKDDHGLADQRYSPFAERAKACAAAIREAVAETGHASRYVPSVSGHLDQLREQTRIARDEGLDTLLIAPMVVGLPAFYVIALENRDMAFLAHPAMGGAARIAPPLLLGKLFRLFGADGVIFPHYGGRFGYSLTTCAAIADAARAEWEPIGPAMAVPAGGMTLDRLADIFRVYGKDMMILIGGGLLSARERVTEEARRFVQQVAKLSEEYDDESGS